MEELYARVLARVPTPQLHENYSAVLHEEYASVSRTLGDVLAAFAKLQEVRNAVSKLQQQSHESCDSVNVSTDTLLELQCQLQHHVETLAVGLEVTKVEKKRKRVDEEATRVTNTAGDEIGSVPCSRVAKKTKKLEVGICTNSDRSKELTTNGLKREVAPTSESTSTSESESGHDEDSGDVGGSEAAWKALMAGGSAVSSQVKAGLSLAGKTQAGVSPGTNLPANVATHFKPILKAVNKLSPVDRSFVIPEVVTVLKESVEQDVDARQQTEVTSCLKIVVDWLFCERKYQAPYTGLYRKYAAVVGPYADQIPESAQKSKFTRLKQKLVSQIKSLEGHPASGKKSTDFVAAIEDAKETKPFSSVGTYRNTIPDHKQLKWLLHVLVSFKKETADGVSNSFGDRMIKVIIKLTRWFSEDRRDPLQMLLYRMIVNAFQEFSNRTPKVSARLRVVKLLEDMSEAVLDPSPSQRLAEIRNCVTQTLGTVKQYQTRLIPPKEARKLTDAVTALSNDVTMGWHPYLDATMRECVKELKNVLLHAKDSSENKPRKIFEACLARFSKWK